MSWRLAARLARRELRGGIHGFRIFLACLALGVAAALFWGSGTRFWMLLFTTNWAVFSLLTMQAMELPLFIWFCRKHGINIGGRD